VFREHAIDAVMHFAARSIVSESVQDPDLHVRNNVTGTLNLLDAMREAGVGSLVFLIDGRGVRRPAIHADRRGAPVRPDQSIRLEQADGRAPHRGTLPGRMDCGPSACATSTRPAPTSTAKPARRTSPRPT
jgi:hypothetical protein